MGVKNSDHHCDLRLRRVDRARLVELCQAFRRSQKSDWAQVAPTRRRWMRFSKLFARGS